MPGGTGVRRALATALVFLAGYASLAMGGEPAAAAPAAESIYRQGLLPSGVALKGERDNGVRVVGKEAACANCHQRSGLGAREGRIQVPPITGRYLFRPIAKAGDEPDIPYVEGMRGEREPYTDETLARAIRQGIDSQGRTMGYLMPRYDLGDADTAALIAYLKGLDKRRQPGVTNTLLHFATIITPDADPSKRKGMLDVLNQFFAERNARQMSAAPSLLSSGKTAYAKSMFMVHRRWELHVWELTGAADTWEDQLQKHLVAEPVLAVISGLGGANWAPVQAFCEHAALPCLFPNVEAPPADADHDFYTVYFSKGVLLEAELMAKRLLDTADKKKRSSVTQIYRLGDSGEPAAKALAKLLIKHGVTVHDHALAATASPQAVTGAISGVASSQSLVLWLRPPDLAAIDPEKPAPDEVYVSGVMAGLEHAVLPPSWRNHARLAYIFDLPERRRVRIDFPLGWFRMMHIPVTDEQVQTDTYLACGLLSETLKHMIDAIVRDYLVERIQYQIDHRITTGYYPRLSLASGQRFASKGGYLVRFAGPTGTRLIPEGSWIAP